MVGGMRWCTVVRQEKHDAKHGCHLLAKSQSGTYAYHEEAFSVMHPWLGGAGEGGVIFPVRMPSLYDASQVFSSFGPTVAFSGSGSCTAGGTAYAPATISAAYVGAVGPPPAAVSGGAK